MNVDEALRIINERKQWTGSESDLCHAAATLAEHCSKGNIERIGVSDLLKCLDVPGYVYECGEFGLYVLTGKRHRAANKEGWIEFLTTNGYLEN